MNARPWDRITRRVAGGVVAALLVLMAAGSDWTAAQNATIRLVIDYGDGISRR